MKKYHVNMSEKNIKYGKLMKGVLMCFVDTMTAGYSSIQGRKGANLSLLIDNLSEMMNSIKSYQEKRKKILRTLKNLEKKEILDLVEKDGKITVYLKDTNNPKIIEYSIESLLNFKKKNKQWNGKWFLVFFDVPEIQRNKRDYLRRFLTRLGFYQYQKSVYLFPYECEEEINKIKKIVEGAKYIKYIIAEKIEDEGEVRKHFKLI